MDLEKHKFKIWILGPLLLLGLLILGAIAVLLFGISNSGTSSAVMPALNKVADEQFKNLPVQAKSYIVYDATSKQVIYSKNALAQLPLASITKVMSALVALDLAPEDAIIQVRPGALSSNPNDKAALIPGQWRLADLLRYTLISSSNSGINTISDALSTSQNFLGGEQHFVELMNDKAKTLGLHQTYFLNESGLDVDTSLAGAYGSANDVAHLFDYALTKYPDIFGATKYDSIIINSSDGNTESGTNTNTSASQIKGLVASKTGFTELAGGNLAIAFDVDTGHRAIVVVLGSTQDGRFSDTLLLTHATLAYYSLI